MAKLAAKLWKLKTDHKILVQVVHNPGDERKSEFVEYIESLRNIADKVGNLT